MLPTLGRWRGYQVFRPLILRWDFLLDGWLFCVSHVQVQNLRRNVYMKLTPLKFVFHNFVAIVRINIGCLGRKAFLSIFLLFWSIKAWKLFVTKFSLEDNSRLWSGMLLSKIIIQIRLGLCKETERMGSKTSNRAAILVTRKPNSCKLCCTILASKFFVAFEGKHLCNKSLAE